MALDYILTNTGPEVQERLDRVPVTVAQLTDEIADREAADAAETQAREAADAALQDSIGAEATRAEGAEQSLDGRITDVEGKIPQGATPQNPLADKEWVTGSIATATADFITASVNNLINYYLKSETYTREEVQQIIDSIKQFNYQSVPELPTASAATTGIIFLVPSSDPQSGNVKDEYITVYQTNEMGVMYYSWEQIGSTDIDLADYYTKDQTDAAITADLNTALASYSTTAQMNTAIETAIANLDLSDTYETKGAAAAVVGDAGADYNTLAKIQWKLEPIEGEVGDKPYEAGSGKGLGRKYVKQYDSFDTFKAQFTDTNTVYIVQDDISLYNRYNYYGDVVIGEGSILKFDGGSMYGGNIALKDNCKIIGGRFDDVTVYIYGENVLIKDCHFTNVNNKYRGGDGIKGYVIRGYIDNGKHPNLYQVYKDLDHVVIDGCVIEDDINVPISIDDIQPLDLSIAGYKFNHLTISNNIIKAQYVAITLMGRNKHRYNQYAEVYNNMIYYTGADVLSATHREFFAISVEQTWENVNIHNNYLEGLYSAIELTGSTNITIDNNRIMCVGDYTNNTQYNAIWLDAQVTYYGIVNITNNSIGFAHSPSSPNGTHALGIYVVYAYPVLNITGNTLDNCSIRIDANVEGGLITGTDTLYYNITGNTVSSCSNTFNSPIQVTAFNKTIIKSNDNIYKLGTTEVSVACVNLRTAGSNTNRYIYASLSADSMIRQNSNESLTAWIQTNNDPSDPKVELMVDSCSRNAAPLDNLLRSVDASAIGLRKGKSSFDYDRNKMLFWLNGRWSDANGRLGKVYVYGSDTRLPAVATLDIVKDKGLQFFHQDINKPIYLADITGSGSSGVAKYVEADGAEAKVARKGTTAQRPTGRQIYVGFCYYDTDLGKNIYASSISSSSVTWVDANGEFPTPASAKKVGLITERPALIDMNVGYIYVVTDAFTADGTNYPPGMYVFIGTLLHKWVAPDGTQIEDEDMPARTTPS